ncbi:MAG: hypothetical protein H6529_15285 [Nocardioides sp.]|nr:hypothetical protein [Nocardioidaceae bacterium]MCB8957828.1 hypothetical protein [Nocardioides sp.]
MNRRRPWLALVPQSDLDHATPGLGLTVQAGRRLGVAMLEDTVTALSRVERICAVAVVWEHPADLEEIRGLPRVMHLVARYRGVDQAVADAEQQLRGWIRRSGRIVVAGNLPAGDRGTLDRLLDHAATSPRCVLPDPHGRGITVMTAGAGTALHYSFDRNAVQGFHAHGTRVLPSSGFPTLARDVHTLADLREAMRLGVGPATLAVARDLYLAPEHTAPRGHHRVGPRHAAVPT